VGRPLSSDCGQELGFLLVGQVIDYWSISRIPNLGALKLLFDGELEVPAGAQRFLREG
jgi:hypothetical protein